MLISVICVYNNKQQFETQLKKSIDHQIGNIEMIALDNTMNRFRSASQALNYGSSIAKGEVLIYSHQDIYLKTNSEIEELAEFICKSEIGDIIGTQGVKEKSREYYTNLTSGREYKSQLVNNYTKRLYEVSCVDEGLFGMRAETWKQHPFSENICNNWHLYCVEACLYARKNGHHVSVYPCQLHHFSRGVISKSYMNNLKKLCKIYRRDFKYIWTTCYKVRTNIIYINCLVFAWKMNRMMRGNLH